MSVVNWVFGALSACLGVVALTGAALSLSAAQAAWLRIKAEPEDFYGVLLLAGLGLLLGVAAIVTGWVLIRGRALGRLSLHAASALSAGIASTLLALSALGFMSDRSTSMELRLLPIPAMTFLASAYLLARLKTNPTA